MSEMVWKPEAGGKAGWRFGVAVAVLVAAVAALGLWMGRSSPLGPGRSLGQLAPPEGLDRRARAELHARMRRHATDMQELGDAVLVLDEARIERAATQVENQEATFGQRAKTDLDAHLPPRFGVLHAQLGAESRALAEAARAHDANRIAEAYGRLATTCVSCHAEYRAARR